jgi:hypothetical protein
LQNEIDLLADEGVYIENYDRSLVEVPLAVEHSRGKHRYIIIITMIIIVSQL